MPIILALGHEFSLGHIARHCLKTKTEVNQGVWQRTMEIRSPQSHSKKYCESEVDFGGSPIFFVGVKLEGASGIQAGPDCIALAGSGIM